MKAYTRIKKIISSNKTPEKLEVKTFFSIKFIELMNNIKPTIPPIIIEKITKNPILISRILCLIATKMKATKVPTNEVMIQGKTTSAGLLAFSAARYPMMEVGIRVRPAAWRHINIIWASLALLLSVLSSCRLSIALRPKGVAAESNPNRLAAKFKVIYDIEGWLLGREGNIFLNAGLRN